MKTLEELTREERNLLLYVEHCAVDHDARLNIQRINHDDIEILNAWTADRFVEYGRVCSAHLSVEESSDLRHRTSYCRLSDEAMAMAGKLRAERAKRAWATRSWRSTKEERWADEGSRKDAQG